MCTFYKYMRISTDENKQNFKRQENSLKKWEDDNKVRCVDYKDEASGSTFDREEWKLLEANILQGDTIVFKDITRFTRNKTEGYHKYMELVQRGINLVFLDNPTCNTDYIKSLIGSVQDDDELSILNITMNYIAKLMLITELDRAEEQRKYISKAITDGIKASNKKSGRTKGNLDKLTPALREQIKLYIQYRYFNGEKISGQKIIDKFNITRNTFHKYVNYVRGEFKE